VAQASRVSWRSAAVLGPLLISLLAVACGGESPPRLLLLVTVDTLRADELGAYGSERGLTPHLDALAEQGLVFERAYASSAFTLPSIATLLTGRYPEELGIWNNESGVPSRAPTLAGALARRGWHTAAVVGNFVLRRSSGVAKGFEQFDDRFGQAEAVRRWPERIAGDTTDAALALLDDCASDDRVPCFLWVHYQDPHGPYDPPGARRAGLLDAERAAPGGTQQLPVSEYDFGIGAIPSYQYMDGQREVAWYRAGYRGEIQYMDEQVGRLLAAVDGAGLRERSVVVFAADHGEALGEEGVWFAHGSGLGDDQVRVPLLLRAPDVAPGRRSDVVSLRDVRPTLLAKFADVTPGPATGRDLLAPGARDAESEPYMATLGAGSKRRYGIVSGGYKFVVSEGDGVFHGRLHRLGREDVDLSASAPQVAADLRQRLQELRRGLRRSEETVQALSEEDRERLRALGYGDVPQADEPRDPSGGSPR